MKNYNINREAAKMSAMLLDKIDEYKYLKDEDTLPSDQIQIIEEAKFSYSHLGKVFEKQTNTFED